MIFLNPEFALDALLELLAFNKLLKHNIILIPVIADLVLLACHILMECNSTFQTVLLLAHRAMEESFILFFIVCKYVFAIRSRTPRHLIIFLKKDVIFSQKLFLFMFRSLCVCMYVMFW